MLAEKRRLKSMPTFAAAAEAVLAQMRPGWRNPKHGKDWLSSMERFAFPRLGKLPVSEVASADVVEALRKVWHERPATARRVRQRISTVMEWAVALNYRDDNPCSRIGPVLGPLSGPALAILNAARSLANGNPLVFPSVRGKRMNDMVLSGLLKTLEVPAVPHGFRSTFRDWAAEETDHPREVVEAALAHVVQNKVEEAYARSDLFERRRQLMDDWAAHVGGGAADDRSS